MQVFNKPTRAWPADWPVHISYFALCLAAVAASMLLNTDGNANTLRVFGRALPIYAPCPFRLLTGYRCPACGMTRAFVYMSHFDPQAAFRMNPAGPPFYLLCLFELPYRLILLLRGQIPGGRLLPLTEQCLFIASLVVMAAGFLSQFI